MKLNTFNLITFTIATSLCLYIFKKKNIKNYYLIFLGIFIFCISALNIGIDIAYITLLLQSLFLLCLKVKEIITDKQKKFKQ